MNTDDVGYLSFGRRLYMERKKARMTQERLAELLNVSPTHIHHLEKGEPLSFHTITNTDFRFAWRVYRLSAGR